MIHQQQCPQATNNPARPTSETCPAIPESGDLLTKTKRIQSWKTIFFSLKYFHNLVWWTVFFSVSGQPVREVRRWGGLAQQRHHKVFLQVCINGKVWSLIQSSNKMVFSDNSSLADNSLYVILWSKLTCCAGSPLWCDGLTEGRTGPCIHHQPYHESWCFNFYKVNHVNLFPIISILMI